MNRSDRGRIETIMIFAPIILLSAADAWPTFLPFEIFERNGFSQFESAISSDRRVHIVRPADGASMQVHFAQSSPELVRRSAGPGMEIQSSTGWTHGVTPSGYPLGTLVSYFQGGNVTLRGGGHSEHVGVTIYGPSFREGRSRGRRAIVVAEESQFVERALRYALGHFSARRLSNDGSVSVGGHGYSAMKASGTNTRYIDLGTWAAENGLVVSAGQDGTVKSFTKAGKLWVIPLAAAKIKKGSIWHSLPDLVMRKDGKYYVPVAALQ